MKILGIHDGHNASAALMIDGQIAALINEERLTYRKNEMGFPQRAIEECLKIGGIKAVDIDLVAFSMTDMEVFYLRVKRMFSFTIKDWLNEQENYWKPKLYENRENKSYFTSLLAEERFNEPQAYNFDGVPAVLTFEENRSTLERVRKETLLKLYGIEAKKVVAFDHHTCHMHYAYFGSPFRDSPTIIFSGDSGGDGANGVVAVARENKIRELARNNCTNLARIYRYITLILGMKMNEHEYKVMGLAPYASQYEIDKCDKAFNDLFHVPDLLIEQKNIPPDHFYYFKEKLVDCRFDGIAGAVQQLTERVGTEWFRKVTKKLEIKRVVFSGGLSMNVKLNQKICELDSVEEFYCPTSGGDESLSLGACYIGHSKDSKSQPSSVVNNYLGPHYSQSEILKAVSILTDVEIQENTSHETVAQALKDGLVIGRFVGKMEFGARSLGNRSIIADPSDPKNLRKINKKIKFRDFWMPFSPSIIEDYAEKYIINPKNLASDHMTLTFETTPEGQNSLVAAMHPSDYTVRAHIVTRNNNESYYDLIKAFSSLTGVGAVLNTSFNLHGYPIVCNPEHAVHVFQNSDLDAMLMEDILILRKRE
jgi:carbamoyltransferase